MARIVYGVSGEGSGHSSRAREMAGHLLEQGHTVRLASYDRGYRNLKDDFDTFEIEGLCIASEDNKVSIVKTFTENIMRLPAGFKSLQGLRHEVIKRSPDLADLQGLRTLDCCCSSATLLLSIPSEPTSRSSTTVTATTSLLAYRVPIVWPIKVLSSPRSICPILSSTQMSTSMW